jgi:hypothetical protein
MCACAIMLEADATLHTLLAGVAAIGLICCLVGAVSR